MTVIEIRELTLSLGGNPVFCDASATFDAGRTCGLVGPNGSGKSVLLKLICGFLSPNSGEVFVDPRYLSRGRTFPEHFGIAIDGPAYLPHITGLANLQELANIQKKISTREIRAAMQRLDLDPDSKQRVGNYSLGMKQKLSLTQAFMEDPDVLLLDEPFNALDARSVTLVKDILRDLRAAGKTMIFTSHNAVDIAELSDAIVEIDGLSLRTRDAR
jgi:ABC-2 type transport system ATP-binding protein